jgi:hypothetical protein
VWVVASGIAATGPGCAAVGDGAGAKRADGDRREPDGVFLDVPTATPPANPPSTNQVIPAQRIVALSSPLTPAAARALVRAYFREFVARDESFTSLLAPGARRLDIVPGADLASNLAKRVRAIDYSHVPFDVVASYDELRIVPYEVAPEALRASLGMNAAEVAVEVPIHLQRMGLVRVFGPRVVLVVRRDGRRRGWKIGGVLEEEGPWQ